MLSLNPVLSAKLDEFCKTKQIPNILFHGSSGSGKKTIVLDFVSRIYNNNVKTLKENVLFINCSQGKGIKYIREELKSFAKYNIHVSHEVPFKTIIMLNFDNLSIDAQSVMRRIIELFINTRFFIIVENKYKLLNPIISRFCSIYIPEHIIDGSVINLHQYNITPLTNGGRGVLEFIENGRKYIMELLEKGGVSISDCENLYEMGISCIDVIKIINDYTPPVVPSVPIAPVVPSKKRVSKKVMPIVVPDFVPIITELKKTEILMRFHILKKEYRCEKLLMFHIFSML